MFHPVYDLFALTLFVDGLFRPGHNSPLGTHRKYQPVFAVISKFTNLALVGMFSPPGVAVRVVMDYSTPGSSSNEAFTSLNYSRYVLIF